MVALRHQRQAEADAKDRAAREAAEHQRRSGLLRLVRDHRRAEEIRAFVDQVLDQQAGAEGAQAWADWARAVADRTDPIARMTFTPDGGCEVAAPVLPEAG